MNHLVRISDLNENLLFNENTFGFDFLHTLDTDIDRQYVTNRIKEIYLDAKKTSNYNPPKPDIIFLSSPMACQLAASLLVRLIYEESQEKEDEIKKEFRNIISYKIWNEVFSTVKNLIIKYRKRYGNKSYELKEAVGTLTKYINFGVIPKVEYHNELVHSGVFEIIYLRSFCIVSELPCKILKNTQSKLHSANSAAIEWRDGFGMYFWNGIRIPKEWILNKESITKSTIESEVNIERRRCLMEIIGIEKYLELLDITCIDKDIDECANPMKLFRTKDKVAIIDEFLFYLNVLDPSTKREYFIPVPPCYDVHWAKAATFKNKEIQYRQGDVGLLNLEKIFDKPVFET